jgi:hypothetical protein
MRETIFTSALSSLTPPSSPVLCCRCAVNEAMLRCRQCGVLQYLCAQCDDETHQSEPLHDREVWLNGYFQPISPTQSVSCNQLISIGKLEYKRRSPVTVQDDSLSGNAFPTFYFNLSISTGTVLSELRQFYLSSEDLCSLMACNFNPSTNAASTVNSNLICIYLHALCMSRY